MPSPFADYARAGFTTELLPILPPGANISPRSKQGKNLAASCGKVPGKKTTDGWYGFASWTEHVTSEAELPRWAGWGAGLGLQTKKYPAVDIDVDVREIADAVETSALLELGFAPSRASDRGTGARRLLVYAGTGFKKRRLAFRLPRRVAVSATGRARPGPDGQGDPGRDDLLDQARSRGPDQTNAGLGEPGGGLPHLDDEVHAVELLGEGQQFVAEGVHSKSGTPYRWRNDQSPAHRGAATLVNITADEVDQFFKGLAWAVENLWDGVIVENTGSQSSASRTGHDAGVPDAPSFEAVSQALASRPNDVSRDEWLTVGMAIKGALGDTAEAYELWEDWSAQHPDNTPEKIEAAWHSFREVHVSWGWLSRWASEAGFNAAEHEFEAVEPGEDGDKEPGPGKPLTPEEAIIKGFVYVETTGEWVRGSDSRAMKREVFNDTKPGQAVTWFNLEERLAEWAANGSKGEKPKPSSAHNLMKGKVRMVQGMTYAAGKQPLFQEGAHGGMVYNIYRAPDRPFAGEAVTESDVAPFNELMDWVLPDPEQQTFMLDYLSFIAQNPGKKVHFAPVLFSRTQGVGKDTVLKVLRYGVVGQNNMASVKPRQLDSEFNSEWAPKQVVLVNELPSFQKRDLYDTIKDYVAGNAGSLSVNPKGLARYEIPNSHCWVFTTNKTDALALETGDRRFVILQAREERMPKELRARVNAFFDHDEDSGEGSSRGLHLAGEWLRRRQITAAFDRYECGLVSTAKHDMTVETMTASAQHLHLLLTDGDWARRQVVQLNEAKEQVGGLGRGLSYSETRKALGLAGFALPAQHDSRRRINVGSRKMEIWVRDVEGAEAVQDGGPPSPLRTKTHRALAQLLWTELKTVSPFAAERVATAIAEAGPRAVE